MPNITWYLILTSGSVLLFIFTLWKSFIPRARTLYVFLFTCGLSYIFEFVIKVLFNSYDYYPYIFNNKWYDSIFGAVVSQGIAVPTIAMCIVSFRLNVLWVIGFCLLLMGIEMLFLRLDIYVHHWWKTIYTGTFTFIGFYLARWWDGLMLNRKQWVDWVNIYLILVFISNTIVYLLKTVAKSHLFHIGVFQDPVRDSVFIEALFIFIHSIVVSFMIQRKWGWFWFIGMYLVDGIVVALYEKIGLVQFFGFWNPALFACLPLVVALLVYWVYGQLTNRLTK
ncbi:hypothetical protein R4Z10_17715 [Niallia sp. XMNu-256]|uniref:hypothetical protein n=1 Tax=Niallia sp. XMNu-256 TaxID=3082444 RepID=UPI0030D0E128